MVKIGVNNSCESNAIKLVDGKYEYSRIQLEGFESKYIYIPLSVIIDAKLDTRRATVFSFLKIHCGLNYIVNFTASDIVKWCGGKPDNRRTNGTNDKVLCVLDALNDEGYLTYLTEQSRSSYMKCRFNIDYYYNKCTDGFAVVYLDEIEKIMGYKKENSKDGTLNNATILLVFAFLRHKIRRRPNELKPEERTVEGIQNRKMRLPEAYDDNINNIADAIGLSSKTLSKIIDILECDLKLIVTDRAYRVKNEDNEFRTPSTIFANAYKREDKYLLITDDDYSRKEIEQKAKELKKMFGEYKINKDKRKTKKKD